MDEDKPIVTTVYTVIEREPEEETYTILEVALDRESAERLKDLWGDYTEILEWEVSGSDKYPVPPGYKVYEVRWLDREGDPIVYQTSPSANPWAHLKPFISPHRETLPMEDGGVRIIDTRTLVWILQAVIYATDEEHARRIVEAKRSELISAGVWGEDVPDWRDELPQAIEVLIEVEENHE